MAPTKVEGAVDSPVRPCCAETPARAYRKERKVLGRRRFSFLVAGSMICSILASERALADGACCFSGPGTCESRPTLLDCDNDGGIYQGDGTDCMTAVCTGACCMADGSCVEGVPEDNCWGQGIPLGLGSDCTGAVCTVGCCLGDGSCVGPVTLNECWGQGGQDVGGPGGDCTGAICTGACCNTDGSCDEPLNRDACVAQAGLWLWPGSTW